MNRRVLIVVSCRARAIVVPPAIWSIGQSEAGWQPRSAARCRTRRGRPGSGSRTLIEDARLENRRLVRPTARGRDPQTRGLRNRGVLSAIYEGEFGDGSPACPRRFQVAVWPRPIPAGDEGLRGEVNEVVGVAGSSSRNARGCADYGASARRKCIRGRLKVRDASAEYSSSVPPV